MYSVLCRIYLFIFLPFCACLGYMCLLLFLTKDVFETRCRDVNLTIDSLLRLLYSCVSRPEARVLQRGAQWNPALTVTCRAQQNPPLMTLMAVRAHGSFPPSGAVKARESRRSTWVCLQRGWWLMDQIVVKNII